MPSSTILTGDDDTSPDPSTPKPDSADHRNGRFTTPQSSEVAAASPKSAPPAAVSASGGGSGASRTRSIARKSEPTLLHDFLLGRPSAARIAAEKKRRESVEALKAELRHEMKQSQVRKLQPPNGVKARVKAWQKANAAAAADATPDDAASEPTDVAFEEEEFKSVTEEDRIRIKMRQKKRSAAKAKPPTNRSEPNLVDEDAKSRVPRKRIVSDDHWVKPKARKVSVRKVSPRPRRAATPPRIQPTSFAFRNTPNPSVSSKVKAWAEKVEVAPPPPRSIVSSVPSAESSPVDDDELSINVDDAASRLTARQSLKTAEYYGSEIRITVTRTKTKHGDEGEDVDGDGDHDDDGASDGGSKSGSERTGTETATTGSGGHTGSRDDGEDMIRVTTIPESTVNESSARESWLDDSEIDLRPPKLLDENSIEVKPLSPVGSEISTPRQKRRAPLLRQRSKTTSAPSSSSTILENLIKAVEEATELSRLTDDPDIYLDHAVKRRRSKSQPATKRSSATRSRKNSVDHESALSDDVTIYSANHPPSVMDKSVADISGEIPFGHSAFSELELPMREPSNSRSRAKTKQQRKNDKNSTMRGMPNMLKKVVEEGKKMLHDMNEPPRNLAPNNPPSIEKWLSNTVDMLEAESAAPTKPLDDDLAEPEPIEEPKPRRKPSQETRRSARTLSNKASSVKTASTTDVTVRESPGSTPKASRSTPRTSPKSHSTAAPKRMKSQSSNPGLRRSRATRSSSSLKSAGKRPLLGVLKEAFQGESSGHVQPSGSYRSHEERHYEPEEDLGSQYTHSVSDMTSWADDSRSGFETESSTRLPHEASRLAAPRFRPPTNGSYELSTILSDEDDGPARSEAAASDDTQSTVTRSTTVTRRTGSTRPPHRQGSGLKRRLTKHSDLVSVLSTPDDSRVPERIRSNRSRPSLRRARRVSADVTNDDLLREFADDENLYQRELKTLVDGVIPVLLNHVMGNMTGSELFGPSAARERIESMSKAVVSMGVCLDKLKHAHKKAPGTDLRKLAHWAHGVVPIYNHYLAAWRLGFQDLIVNLAPRGDDPDDEDSLLNLLPRNEIGDLLNADGERVAVAYLLKRPLIRIKQMSKLIKCIDSIYDTPDTSDLRRDFEALQEKSRRRHREEVARLVDEEAIATDKTRARDLRTLGGAKPFTIAAARQVNAKDVFSLDLVHSNGQRLECRVELVHRDKQDDPKDDGDLLIREVGDGNRTYLLFPPVSMTLVSARAGDGELDMVVMIRGSHNGRSWYELLTLYADEEEQVADWLQILPPSPIPARAPEPSVLDDLGDEDESPFSEPGAPIGTQSIIHQKGKRKDRTRGEDQEEEEEEEEEEEDGEDDQEGEDRSSLHKVSRSLEGRTTPTPTPGSKDSPSLRSKRSSTLEREDSNKIEADEWQPRDDAPLRGPSVKQDMRHDRAGGKKGAATGGSGPYKGADGAPPPPIHRTLSSNPQQKSKSQSLKPPVELYGGGVRRRTSSPLKHEYLPSDVSSPAMSELSPSEASSVTEGDEEAGEEERHDDQGDQYEDDEEASDLESSEDELDSLDEIPQTELGFSIRKGIAKRHSVVASECSLTPSNSASQAGLHGHKSQPEERNRFLASISMWTETGAWRDVSSEQCSVIVSDGLVEAYAHCEEGGRPLLALDLTPLVLIRQSTSVDLEIRSSLQSHCKLAPKQSGGNFRFRCLNTADCYNLYMMVHHARLHNRKFIQLENESRFRSFGERRGADQDAENGSKKRGWFGRRNSYRSSVRAPAQSNDGVSSTPSSASANSFLRRLNLVGNFSFNLARSSINKNSPAGSPRNSIYTSNSGSSSGSGSGTPPRSPSADPDSNSGEDSSSPSPSPSGTEELRIRLHLLVSAAKWEDHGNCTLQIRRPPPGWRQALRADLGLEKRITVTTIPKKGKADKPAVLLDAVLGSGCFSPMGTRGIVCGIWEELRDHRGVVGKAGATGPTGGNIKKWCFQFSTVGEANWVLRLVHQEVMTV